MIMYILSVSCKNLSFLHYTSNHAVIAGFSQAPDTLNCQAMTPWKCHGQASAEVGSVPVRNRITAQRRTKISLKRWKILHLSKRNIKYTRIISIAHPLLVQGRENKEETLNLQKTSKFHPTLYTQMKKEKFRKKLTFFET